MRSQTWHGVLGFCVSLLLACDGAPEALPSRRAAAITGGQLDEGDPAVVWLKLSNFGGCSGTLISPRMVLTAAHCELVAPQFGTVSFGTSSEAPVRTVPITDTVRHPSLDLRLVKLSRPIGDVAPLRINRVALSSAEVGQPLRHVGFGLDNYPRGTSGTKREATLTINSIPTTEIIFSSDDRLKGVCFGDSGGPGLLRLGGSNEEVVAGVASHLVGEPACYAAAADIRVDPFVAWIDEVSAVWEAPTCDPGNGCQAGCVPTDSDCFCVYDNVCDPRCSNLALDPDCDPECAQDGVCSGATCPFRDPDCVAPGSTCTQDAQCQSRTCASQAGKRFCSQGCTSTEQCPSMMYCSPTNHVCLLRPLLNAGCDPTRLCGEGICADEPDGGQACRSTCETSAGCPTDQQCIATSNLPGICRARLAIEPPVAKKQGCACAPGELWLELVALLALRRLRGSTGRPGRRHLPADRNLERRSPDSR